MEEKFNDWTFGIFLLVFAIVGMWVVPAYNKMVERLEDKSEDLNS